MKRIVTSLVLLLLVSMTLRAAGGSGALDLTDDEKQLVKSNNNFAFNLFRQARTGDNQMLSPLSVTYALGMLNNGAAGQTSEEILQTLMGSDVAVMLSSDGQTQMRLNAFCRKLLDKANKLDKATTVGIANTIYVDRLYELQPAFVEKAQQYYDATPEARDFHDGQTLDAINQWCYDHTNGMIPRMLTEESFNADAVSYLLNALYFKGPWVFEFNPDMTSEMEFNGKEMVPMMHANVPSSYTENDLYQAVNLYYGNGAYLMTVFLPREGKTIGDVLEQMDGESWQRAVRGGNYDVELSLPRFETDGEIDLKPVMKALGVEAAFDWRKAEFPYFCTGGDVFIGQMRQKSHIKVDEKGTEAAAVTYMDMALTGIPRYVEFCANRPFFYTISEQSTGTIFFIGQFTGNAGESRPVDMGVKTAKGADTRGQQDASASVYNLHGQRLSAPPAHGIYLQGGKKWTK